MYKKNEELINKGIKCLIDNIGYSEANEFLYQIVKNNMEYFDYTEWRREHLFEDMTDEELQADILRRCVHKRFIRV